MESKPDSAPTSPEEEKVAAAAAAAAAEPHEEVATPVVLKKGPWTTAEDAVLMKHVRQHGEGNWNAVQRMTGLLRCGKSCRLRWTNHLRPNLKKGSFCPDEELLIAQLHAQLGNKWARMASHLPGRTDNEIKNYWNTRTKRRRRAGLPVYPPEVQLQIALSKRCRHDGFSPLSSPQQSGSNVLSLDAASAGYTSSRPQPLDLVGQLAMANRPVQLLAPTPFSAPCSPWAKPFARNAQYFQFAHLSPTTPLSPSPGARVELPSSQLRPAVPLSSAAAAAPTGGGLGGEALQDQPNTASLEAMLQELHDAIKTESPAPVNGNTEGGHGGGERHGVSGGNNNKSDGGLKDDIDTLFDLMIPTTFRTPEPAVPAAAPNHSGSISQHSSDDQDHHCSNVGLGMDLPVIGSAGSSEQDWSQLDGACQWNNMSGIC